MGSVVVLLHEPLLQRGQLLQWREGKAHYFMGLPADLLQVIQKSGRQ